MNSLAPACKDTSAADGVDAGDANVARPLLPGEPTGDDLDPPTVGANPVASFSPRSNCFSWLPCRVFSALWTSVLLALKLIFIVASLALYSLLLMPGFVRMMYYYFCTDSVVRGILYGGKPRQRLDLHFPPHARRGATYPVVIYLTGGAWTIGYKAWGALLARRLSQQGVLVACLDYRNFPQGDALDMLEDVNTGIAWVLSRVHRFGGDPDSVTLVGQSAGGHLAGLALLKQAEQAARGHPVLGSTPAWSPTRLRAFVGVSGAFDLVALAEHRGGTFRGLLDRILAVEDDSDSNALEVGPGDVEQGGSSQDQGRRVAAAVAGAALTVGRSRADRDRRRGRRRPAYTELSPLEAARRLPPGAAAQLPFCVLLHGAADRTVPCEGSARLSEALNAAGARCRCVLVPGKTHTAFLLEDPMRGGADLLTDTVLSATLGQEEEREKHDGGQGEGAAGSGLQAAAGPHVHDALCPGFLCNLAGWVVPF